MSSFSRGATLAVVAFCLAGAPVAAQQVTPPATDSALVLRILTAEEERDADNRVFGEISGHPDERIRRLGWRARARILDVAFAARDSLPPLDPAPEWPEPEWVRRLRAVNGVRDDCAALHRAMGDSIWPVRQRAASLVTASCAGHQPLVATLHEWLDSPTADTRTRQRFAPGWRQAAHGLIALSRVRPDEAREYITRLLVHPYAPLRTYAIRAATITGDTARVRRAAQEAPLASADGNVMEAAIDGLASLTGHADDSVFIAALTSGQAQVVRAAARALVGSSHPDAAPAATAAFERWVARDNASARDVRVALLAVAGRPASEDRPPAAVIPLPADAVALALGADVRVRVTMDAGSGGGAFTVRLRGDIAPIMAARILALVREGYYDGLTWHRVEHDFVIQGGSPGANEYVGYRQFLRDELATLRHPRGTVGMSTRGHDTGDAQWFVNLRDNARLTADYTIFAEVVDGMDVVDRILEHDIMATVRVVNDGR